MLVSLSECYRFPGKCRLPGISEFSQSSEVHIQFTWSLRHLLQLMYGMFILQGAPSFSSKTVIKNVQARQNLSKSTRQFSMKMITVPLKNTRKMAFIYSPFPPFWRNNYFYFKGRNFHVKKLSRLQENVKFWN